jgi:hypothetical protein
MHLWLKEMNSPTWAKFCDNMAHEQRMDFINVRTWEWLWTSPEHEWAFTNERKPEAINSTIKELIHGIHMQDWRTAEYPYINNFVSIKLLGMWWNCLFISPVKHNSVSGSKNKHNIVYLCVSLQCLLFYIYQPFPWKDVTIHIWAY